METKGFETPPVFNIIPEPKKITGKDVRYYLPGHCRISCGADRSEDYEGVVNFLKDEFHGLSIKMSAEPARGLGAEPGKVFLAMAGSSLSGRLRNTLGASLKRDIRHKEGYLLDVSEEGIAIVADEPDGLIYGVRTLQQLLGNDGKGWFTPGVTIEDWPDLPVRGVHLHLSGCKFQYKYIENFIREISRYKINTLIFEYEDSIRYDGRHSRISHPKAWTKQQVRDLIGLAGSRQIKVIPLLQSLGHVEYILRHPEYRHLREADGVWTQYCPTNPAAVDLFRQLCEELLPLHEGSEYFHIGGDETYHLGRCGRCQKVAAEKGKSGLYVEHINRICEYLGSRGKIPMLWDDVLAENPGRLPDLYKDAVIVYWDYTPADAETPFILFRNQGYYCDRPFWEGRRWKGEKIPAQRIRDLSAMPGELLAAYRKYLDSGHFPRYLRHYPFHKFYLDSGHRVIGAPASIGGEYNYCCINHRRRLENVVGMTGVVQAEKGDGVIVTSWFGGGVTKNIAWYPLLAAAEHTWYFGGVSEEEFNRKFEAEFFGVDNGETTRTMLQMGENPSLCYNEEDNDESDLKSRGAYAVGNLNLKGLLDKRIEKFKKAPGVAESLRRNEKIRRKAEQSLAVLKKNRKLVRKNSWDYDNLILAARLTAHKARQALLFCEAEFLLEKRNRTRLRRAGKETVRQLEELKKEIASLKKDLGRMFGKILEPFFVKRHQALVFAGEAEKTEEYIESISEEPGDKDGKKRN